MHLTSYVKGLGEHRGGLWLVGPTGVMKSTFLDFLEPFDRALFLADLNVQGLMQLRGQLTVGAVRTIVLPEFQKLYERDPRTAANVEGTIRALVEEGYRGASFEAAGINRFKIRAMVIGAMTDDLQAQMWHRWETTGFARRFLWCLIRLEDSEMLMRAVELWRKRDFGNVLVPMTPNTLDIENNLTVRDREQIRPLVRYQPQPNNFCFEMLCKVACVLRWHYGRYGIKKDALETVAEFSRCLGSKEKEGADIVFPNTEGKRK